MEAVAETGMTVILSSHIVADLERVCDHLVILAAGGVQLAGPIDEIVASHRLLTGPRSDPAAVARVHDVIRESHTERQTTLLVRANGHVYDSRWQLHEVDLEEIVLAYLGHATARHHCAPRARRWRAMTWLSWRQQRTETLIAPASSPCSPRCSSRPASRWPSAYHHDGLSACLGLRAQNCSIAIETFTTASSRSASCSPGST